MLKKVFAGVVLAAMLMSATVAMAEDVYVTKSGKKYHKEDCRLIQSKDKEEISMEDAAAKGLKPCGKCFTQEVSQSGKEKKKELSKKQK